MSSVARSQDDRATLKLKATHSRKLNIELRQLKHDLQLAKIALAQRDYQLNSMRVEYANKCEQLHEANRELTHQNHMLNVRLSNIMAVCSYMIDTKTQHMFLSISIFDALLFSTRSRFTRKRTRRNKSTSNTNCSAFSCARKSSRRTTSASSSTRTT